MNTTIPSTKYGNCGRCKATDTAVIKRGKRYFCLKCVHYLDAIEQLNNRKEKVQVQKQLIIYPRRSGTLIKTIQFNVRPSIILDTEGELLNDRDLRIWYYRRNAECTGICLECEGATTKGNSIYWKFAICHIMAKSIFPSVKTHPQNFIELCHFGNSHHANFDNNGYEYAKNKMPNAWKIIVERFLIMYPHIKEADKIPDILLAELKQPTNEDQLGIIYDFPQN